MSNDISRWNGAGLDWLQKHQNVGWFMYGCLEREQRLNLRAWSEEGQRACWPWLQAAGNPPGIERKPDAQAAPLD